MFDLPGDKAYVGSQFGAITVNPSGLGSTASPFAYLPASGTPMGLITGKVIAVSHNGAQAVFSDTVSTPNQVYLFGASSSALPFNINSATAAAFSPDGLKTFILGDGGNTLYIFSPLQYLEPPIALPAAASSIVFNSTGSFALLSGGSSPGTLAVYNTCDSSAVTPALSAGNVPGPPIFLKMVPSGNVPMGNPTIPTLQTQGLDFFFGVDSTGIDIIATTTSLAPLTTLCPQQITLAQTSLNTTFLPIHIDLGVGSFTPINFFISPDSTKAYIVASDSSGILVYNFNTSSTSAIPLVNNATPLSADMTVDGSLIYVAGSDGLLHEVNTALSLDRMDVTFVALPNSSNSFCYDSSNCALNMIAVRP
jgi:WD40 repeat protein